MSEQKLDIFENAKFIESVIPKEHLDDIVNSYNIVFNRGKYVEKLLYVPISIFAFQPTDINSIKIDCEFGLCDYLKNKKSIEKILKEEFLPVVEQYKKLAFSLLRDYPSVTENQLFMYCKDYQRSHYERLL